MQASKESTGLLPLMGPPEPRPPALPTRVLILRMVAACSFIFLAKTIIHICGGLQLSLLRSSVVCQATPPGTKTAALQAMQGASQGLAHVGSEFSGSQACSDKAAVLRIAQRLEGKLESTSSFAHLLLTPLLALIADTRGRTVVLLIAAICKFGRVSLLALCSLRTLTGHSLDGPAHSTLPLPVMFLTAALDSVGWGGPMNAFAGDFSPPEMRGRVFTVLTVAHAVSSIISAFINARILHLDLTSYTFAYFVLTGLAVSIFFPLASLARIERAVAPERGSEGQPLPSPRET